MRLARFLLDLMFPPVCVGCRRRGEWLCPKCREGLRRLDGATGHSRRVGPLEGVWSAYAFDGALRQGIHQLKYRGARHLAEPLGALLLDSWQLGVPAADVVVPVPLHPSRERERGYNQSALLAAELAREIGLPVDSRTLRRTRPTPPQTRLSAAERRQNVVGAFVAAPGALAGRRALLVDDVCTTGSTLAACAAALRSAGCAGVWAVTVARAVD